MTGLVTEAIKRTFVVKSPNKVALIASITSGVCVPMLYFAYIGNPPNWQDVVYIIAMPVLTWLCSTLGFDKVKQLFVQLKG